jgi:hypothetical protein
MRSSLPAATMMLLHKRGSPALLLPEFLREVYLGQRTGLLHVTRRDETSFSFRAVNGELVSGASSAPHGRLGETMVRHGLLSRNDLERALVIVRARGRRLAPVLRELELVDTPKLERALALHIRSTLMAVLVWDEALLLFEDQELPESPAEDLTLRCSMAELVLEVVRRIPLADTVRQALGSLDRPIVAVDKPPFRLDRTTLSPADGYVLKHANGRTRAHTMIVTAPIPAELVERSLLWLLCTGVVRYGEPSQAAATPA